MLHSLQGWYFYYSPFCNMVRTGVELIDKKHGYGWTNNHFYICQPWKTFLFITLIHGKFYHRFILNRSFTEQKNCLVNSEVIAQYPIPLCYWGTPRNFGSVRGERQQAVSVHVQCNDQLTIESTSLKSRQGWETASSLCAMHETTVLLGQAVWLWWEATLSYSQLQQWWWETGSSLCAMPYTTQHSKYPLAPLTVVRDGEQTLRSS